jgi:hypothetical protein
MLLIPFATDTQELLVGAWGKAKRDVSDLSSEQRGVLARTRRSKNVVSIAANGEEKRGKEANRRGEWLIGFCYNSSASFGLA